MIFKVYNSERFKALIDKDTELYNLIAEQKKLESEFDVQIEINKKIKRTEEDLSDIIDLHRDIFETEKLAVTARIEVLKKQIKT